MTTLPPGRGHNLFGRGSAALHKTPYENMSASELRVLGLRLGTEHAVQEP